VSSLTNFMVLIDDSVYIQITESLSHLMKIPISKYSNNMLL